MIGQHVYLECTDRRQRRLTVTGIETAGQIFATSEPLTDTEAHGVWVWGRDGSGVLRLANTTIEILREKAGTR